MLDSTARQLGGGGRAVLLFALALILGAALHAIDVTPAASQTATLASIPVTHDPGLDPAASVWSTAPPLVVPLSSQNVTYPVVSKADGPSTVTLRAVNTRTRLYVRVEWRDATRNDRLLSLDDFTDAVAVEFPTQASVSAPAICMGQADGEVNIWQWRAVLQATDQSGWRQTHPAMYVDDDPWSRVQPDLALPARYLGNLVAGGVSGPVSDLTAQAFGTLAPTERQLAEGTGVWAEGRWSVVFARELSVEAADEAALGGGVTTDMAFAVWDGAQGNRNGQKVVSQFVKLSIPASMTQQTSRGTDAIPFVIGALVALAGAGAVLWWEAKGSRREQ